MIHLNNETGVNDRLSGYNRRVYTLWAPFKRADNRSTWHLTQVEQRSILRLAKRCLLDMANLFRIHVRDGTIPDSEARQWRAGSSE